MEVGVANCDVNLRNFLWIIQANSITFSLVDWRGQIQGRCELLGHDFGTHL